MEELAVQDNERGMRLDAFLVARFPACSLSTLRRLIARGCVLRNGRPQAKGSKVGGVLVLTEEPTACPEVPQPNSEITPSVIYEDDALIGVDKPAGMNCHPNHPEELDTLANGLLARYPELQGIGDSPLMCGILHRIDGGTSGLVLAARTQVVYESLRAQFAAREIEKIYYAIVEGNVPTGGTLENLLAHHPNCPGRMVDAAIWKDVQRPMVAVTRYEPVERFEWEQRYFTKLRVTIYTGVTHQIRAQLSFAGMPIVGDKRYGGIQLPGLDRHLLHAFSAKFKHPISDKVITLTTHECSFPPFNH